MTVFDAGRWDGLSLNKYYVSYVMFTIILLILLIAVVLIRSFVLCVLSYVNLIRKENQLTITLDRW